MIRYGYLLTIVMFTVACNTKSVKPLAVLSPFQSSVTDSIYSAIRPKVQRFTVNNNTAKTITATGGTSILFPSECFLNAAGKVVEGDVQVELVEAQVLKDFISSGLATVSDGKLLLSNGMMFINATANGQPLQLDTANPLTVTMPTIGSAAGFQMFTGNGSNWQPDSTMMEEPDYEFTLPLQVLYPKGNQSLSYCFGSYPGGEDRYYCLDTTVMNIMDKKYENTCIATIGFVYRYHRLLSMTHWMSYIRRGIKYIKQDECENNDFDLSLYKEYLDHPTRSFRETDSVVRSIYVNYFKTNKIRLENFCDSVNKELRHYYANWTDTSYQFDFRKRSLEQQYMDLLTDFSYPKILEIKNFDTKGVDPGNPDAFNQLRQKGVAVKEINEILKYHFLRNQLITTMTEQNENEAAKDKIEKIYATTAFSVNKMGWINCDRFYDDPAAGKADIAVSDNSGQGLKYIDCSLVIPSLNVRLAAWQNANGTYTFTQKDGRYIKLPIGIPAVVVGTALQNKQLYFSAQKISIKDGISVNLLMKPIATESLSDSLQAVVKK